jgi:hypothetical protein
MKSLGEELMTFPDEEEFFAEHPDWKNHIREFKAGHFILENGKQDELLQSIADQWDRRGSVSEKQMRAFIGRCAYYCEEKMKGNPLTTPEDKRRRGDIVDPLMEKADSIGGQFFSEAEQKKIDSFRKWYDSRGYLTIRQVDLLVKILKKAESRM